MEELALALAQDGAQEVADAAFGMLLPALLAWCQAGEHLHASLLPHALATITALLEQCGARLSQKTDSTE